MIIHNSLQNFYPELVAQTSYYLGKLNGVLSFFYNPELLVTPLLVAEAVASCRLAGVNTNLISQLQLELVDHHPNSLAEKQTQLYKRALLEGYKYLKKSSKFDLDLVELIYKILNSSEESRSGNSKNSNKYYQSTANMDIYDPVEVEGKLENWLDFAQDPNPKINVLIKAIVLMAEFESIQVFSDYNAQLSRILYSLYLVYQQVLDFPVLYISSYTWQTRTKYESFLQTAITSNDFSEFVDYFLTGLNQKAKLSVDMIYQVLNLKQDYNLRLGKYIPKIYSQNLLDFLFYNPFYNQKTICSELQITRNTAAKYFKLLQKYGFISLYTDGKEKIYVNQNLLNIFL